jgi:hypothetical protein
VKQDPLLVLRRPETAGDRFAGSDEIGVSLGPGPASGGPGAFIDASRRARTALGVTVYVIPAAAATQFRVVPAGCAGEDADALKRALTGVATSLRTRRRERVRHRSPEARATSGHRLAHVAESHDQDRPARSNHRMTSTSLS